MSKSVLQVRRDVLCASLMLFVLSSVCTCTTRYPGPEAYTDPCHVNGSPSVVDVNEAYFHRIVNRIIDDSSSGIKVHCRGLYEKADNLNNIVAVRYPIASFRRFFHNRIYPISCNLAQNMTRTQITECLLSTYEVLKNFTISINAIYSRDFNFERQNIGDLLYYLQELRNSIDRALCSVASNGLSLLVSLNSANVQVGPLDIVSSINDNTHQIQVVIKIYQLTNAIKNTCSEAAVPRTLSQMLHD